jgi:hypothetical protein
MQAMVQAKSIDAFKRSLDERFRILLTDLGAVVDAFASNAPDSRVGPITKLVEAARDIHDYLSDQDRPPWLVQLYRTGQAYLTHQTTDHLTTFLNTLLKHYPSIRAIQFDDDAPIVKFDELFERYRDEGRLPELFDELITIVSDIIQTGEIDSAMALDALRQIVDLLRANRHGSYLAVRSTISLTRYLKNLIAVVLDDIPVIKQLREAFERTVEQSEQELEKIEARITRETLCVIASRVPQIKRLPNYGVDKVTLSVPLALPSPSIDGE